MYWQRCYECEELDRILPWYGEVEHWRWSDLWEKPESNFCFVGWDSSQKDRALLAVVISLEQPGTLMIIYGVDEGWEDGMIALRALCRDVVFEAQGTREYGMVVLRCDLVTDGSRLPGPVR